MGQATTEWDWLTLTSVKTAPLQRSGLVRADAALAYLT